MMSGCGSIVTRHYENSAPNKHGKAVLCNSGTGTATGSVSITNSLIGKTDIQILDPGLSASSVCSKVNLAANNVKFDTDYQDPNMTGVKIFRSNNDTGQIKVEFKRVTLDIVEF